MSYFNRILNKPNVNQNEDDNEERNPYEIQIKNTNKDNLSQPESVDNDIFPSMPCGILIIGRSGAGKSQAMVNIVTNPNLLGNYFNEIYLLTDAKPDKELIKDLNLEKENIITDFDEEKVKSIMDKQEKIIQEETFKKSPKVLLVFDDILSNQKFLKSKTLTRLATANRHFNISYIFCSQYYKKLPAVVRVNARYYMIFPSSMSECEKIAEELCPPQMSKKQFIKYLQHATSKKYSFLSINANSENPLRRLFENVLV